MKRLMISLVGALAFAAVAQAAQPRDSAASDQPAAVQGEANKPALSDAYCLRHTGTRITHRADKRVDPGKARTCSSGMIGRVYTRDDLDRTGEVDIADALRKLDPSIH